MVCRRQPQNSGMGQEAGRANEGVLTGWPAGDWGFIPPQKCPTNTQCLMLWKTRETCVQGAQPAPSPRHRCELKAACGCLTRRSGLSGPMAIGSLCPSRNPAPTLSLQHASQGVPWLPSRSASGQTKICVGHQHSHGTQPLGGHLILGDCRQPQRSRHGAYVASAQPPTPTRSLKTHRGPSPGPQYPLPWTAHAFQIPGDRPLLSQQHRRGLGRSPAPESTVFASSGQGLPSCCLATQRLTPSMGPGPPQLVVQPASLTNVRSLLCYWPRDHAEHRCESPVWPPRAASLSSPLLGCGLRWAQTPETGNL